MAFWLVMCSCGSKPFATRSDALRSGKTASCGCTRGVTNTKHGRSREAVYRIWVQMKQRCSNPNDPWFFNYGGRGIRVSAVWVDSFDRFIADVGERPSARHSLERIHNGRDYEPGNVRWATRVEQMNNTRVNVWIELHGRRMTVAQWSRELDLPEQTIQKRLAKGLPPEEVLSTRHRRGRDDVPVEAVA